MAKKPKVGNTDYKFKRYLYYTVVDIYRYYRSIKKSNKEKYLKKNVFTKIVNEYFKRLIIAILSEGYIEQMGYGLGELKLYFGVTGRHGAMVNWKDTRIVGREIYYNNINELFRYYYIAWHKRKTFYERHYRMVTTPATKKKTFEYITAGNIKLP